MLSDEKRAVRKAIRSRLSELPQARFVACGEAMAATLASMPEFGAARLVLAFLSMKGEIDTRAALASARELGKTIAVPRLAGDEIEFVRLPGDWEAWPLDAFGIPEAPATLEAVAISEIAAGPTLVLTPGLAFDRGGGRLGRGKGYYDRFFASVDASKPGPGHFFALGVCLTEQLVPSVPHDSNDRKVDAVLADARLFGR